MSSTETRSMTATERTIADIWSGLFGTGITDPDADFFALGGTSLTAVKFLARVEDRFGEDALLPETLYEDARLGALAAAIDSAVAAGGTEATAGDGDGAADAG
ncbi:MAG TPA: phosphopantetheine-binding protein [Pseudonocardiaceae bacterium]